MLTLPAAAAAAEIILSMNVQDGHMEARAQCAYAVVNKAIMAYDGYTDDPDYIKADAVRSRAFRFVELGRVHDQFRHDLANPDYGVKLERVRVALERYGMGVTA